MRPRHRSAMCSPWIKTVMMIHFRKSRCRCRARITRTLRHRRGWTVCRQPCVLPRCRCATRKGTTMSKRTRCRVDRQIDELHPRSFDRMEPAHAAPTQPAWRRTLNGGTVQQRGRRDGTPLFPRRAERQRMREIPRRRRKSQHASVNWLHAKAITQHQDSNICFRDASRYPNV